MVLTVLTCCLDSWWPGLVFMAEPTKARRFSARLPKCCQIHQIQIQQLLLIDKLSLRRMDRSMTFWQTFFASDRSKAKATSGRTLETSGWLELTKTSDGKMSMQYYTIYAYLCHIYAICLDMPEKITIFGWNSVDVTRRRRHAPGQAGGGASRITWLGAETTSSDGRSCDILHTDIQYTWIMVH